MLFAERFPQHKEKSKEVFPNKSLRKHNISPIHFELERLEEECTVAIEQTAQAEGWQIDSLIFDGGLLRKREGLGETEVNSLLLRMQENAKANVGVECGYRDSGETHLAHKIYMMPPTKQYGATIKYHGTTNGGGI